MKFNQVWKKLNVCIYIIVVLFLIGTSVGFVVETEQIFRDQFLTTARAYFNNIVLTRRWCANYGGVLVKKEKGVLSSPYLEDPDVHAVDGAVYTKKNPALVTRELSEYAEKDGDFKYHITSLSPVNPKNAAYDFERLPLQHFEKGEREWFEIDKKENALVYRYMAPVFMERSCKVCHAERKYKVGSIRGGISVSIDITETTRNMRRNQLIFICLSIVVSSLLLFVIFLVISSFGKKLSCAYDRIETLSITDELTQTYNRRFFCKRLHEEIRRNKRYGHPLCLFLFDIDYFKAVNDTYGHIAGDAVLQGIASLLQKNTRETDVVARYGGEEFVVLLPETDRDNGYLIAEKIRNIIAHHDFLLPDGVKINVTASFGVASFDMLPESFLTDSESFVKLADNALYSAKKNGRNRVCRATS